MLDGIDDCCPGLGERTFWLSIAEVSALKSCSLLGLVCSTVRLPTLIKLSSSSDPSYNQAPIAVWTHLNSVGIICDRLHAQAL
ncbi:hypothetical protein BDZ45DRAFT_744035 [Acephala macrosclerotiorum]|nr:hypothetical protein BDZ45DRAFT_744035 [Acephala macrosclerotiorum]